MDDYGDSDDWAAQQYDNGAAAERARCIKALTEYRDALTYAIPATNSDRRAVTRAIDALVAATPSGPP